MAHIAFLGTGLLGAAFVEAALGRGDQVTVWNRSPEKARALIAFGARFAATPADAVRDAERVHLVLRDDASVEEVVAVLRPGLGAGAVVVDHTTTQPMLTATRSRRLNAGGVPYLHCPVMIGPLAARKSEGSIFVSGPEVHWLRVKDALAKQATRVDYLGERPDLAAAHKLLSNAWVLGIIALAADVFAIGRGADLSPPESLQVIEKINARSVLSLRGERMVAGDFSPLFELVMARKDVRLMLETAGGHPLAMLPGLAARMDALIDAGLGGEDFAVLGKAEDGA